MPLRHYNYATKIAMQPCIAVVVAYPTLLVVFIFVKSIPVKLLSKQFCTVNISARSFVVLGFLEVFTSLLAYFLFAPLLSLIDLSITLPKLTSKEKKPAHHFYDVAPGSL